MLTTCPTSPASQGLETPFSLPVLGTPFCLHTAGQGPEQGHGQEEETPSMPQSLLEGRKALP